MAGPAGQILIEIQSALQVFGLKEEVQEYHPTLKLVSNTRCFNKFLKEEFLKESLVLFEGLFG